MQMTWSIHALDLKSLQHPPNSRDLAPSNYFQFPNLEKWIGGNRFGANTEIIDVMNEYFNELDKPYYSKENAKIANESRHSI